MIVLIDGDCSLCIGLVEWLGKRIPDERLTPEHIIFVPGESDWGQELLTSHRITGFDSVVVIFDGIALQESEAILSLQTVLPRRWRAVWQMARIIPLSARNRIYRYIARHRLSWFGRAQLCAIDSRVAPVTYGPRGLLTRP